VLFRHALILRGEAAPGLKREIVGRAREVFGIDGAPFETLLDLREKKNGAKVDDPEALLALYMKEIDKVIDVVDGMSTEETAA
jgi:hypothetical protein